MTDSVGVCAPAESLYHSRKARVNIIALRHAAINVDHQCANRNSPATILQIGATRPTRRPRSRSPARRNGQHMPKVGSIELKIARVEGFRAVVSYLDETDVRGDRRACRRARTSVPRATRGASRTGGTNVSATPTGLRRPRARRRRQRRDRRPDPARNRARPIRLNRPQSVRGRPPSDEVEVPRAFRPGRELPKRSMPGGTI